MNYAEQLEHEAYHLARERLTLALKGTKDEGRLPAVLAHLDSIHADAMKAAAEWVQPRRPSARANPPLTADFVTKAAVVPLSRSLQAQAENEASS